MRRSPSESLGSLTGSEENSGAEVGGELAVDRVAGACTSERHAITFAYSTSLVRFVGLPPVAATRITSARLGWYPLGRVERVKVICFPSGDQLGSRSDICDVFVSRTALVPFGLIVKMAGSVGDSGLGALYTIRLPSGDHSGAVPVTS